MNCSEWENTDEYPYNKVATKTQVIDKQLLNTFKMVLVAGSITAFMFGGLYFAFSKKKK
tara:strand:- start:134 stop:310 length:177 start_codon:yes stop_codon:yes gene_type:complete